MALALSPPILNARLLAVVLSSAVAQAVPQCFALIRALVLSPHILSARLLAVVLAPRANATDLAALPPLAPTLVSAR